LDSTVYNLIGFSRFGSGATRYQFIRGTHDIGWEYFHTYLIWAFCLLGEFRLVCLLVCHPLSLIDLLSQKTSIRFQAFSDQYVSKVRFEIAPGIEERNSDDIDVSELVLERVASGSVKEGRHREVKFAF